MPAHRYGAVFDMDGTLVDSLFLWDVIWADFGRRYGDGTPIKLTEEDERAIRTMTMDQVMDLVHENYGIGADGQELLDVTNRVLARFYSSEVCLKDGVKEFLEHCHKNHVPMCIASATALPFVEMAAEHCGIKHYFKAILSCADIGKGKDQPDIYLLAAEKLGLSPEDLSVFEDSPTALETAKKIGMKTIGIYDKYNPGQERVKRLSDTYLAPGESWKTLIESIGIGKENAL